MTDYTVNELDVGERQLVSIPTTADYAETFFPAYGDGESGIIEMDQSINEDLYTIGGDGNPIHYDPDMVQVYSEVMPFFDDDEFADDALIVQGSAFIHDAIAAAEGSVQSVTSTFMSAVDTDDTVYWERDTESLEHGEKVTFALEDGDVASVHELLYDEMDANTLDADTVANRNAANAVKPAKAVGADDQQNNLLIQVNAAFDDGRASTWLSHDDRNHVSDAEVPYNLVDEYSYDDGTTVELKLLEPDQELQDEVAAVYEADTDYRTPISAAIDTQQELLEQSVESGRLAVETMQVYADIVSKSRETAQTVTDATTQLAIQANPFLASPSDGSRGASYGD